MYLGPALQNRPCKHAAHDNITASGLANGAQSVAHQAHSTEPLAPLAARCRLLNLTRCALCNYITAAVMQDEAGRGQGHAVHAGAISRDEDAALALLTSGAVVNGQQAADGERALPKMERLCSC